MATTFDTLQTARTPESAGLPRQQAEAVIATAVNRMKLAQLAIAGALFAALKLL